MKATISVSGRGLIALPAELRKAAGTSTKVCGSLRFEMAPNLPEKDRPVLAASIHHRCQILFTGDKMHLGSRCGQTIEGVEIHFPASLAFIYARSPKLQN